MGYVLNVHANTTREVLGAIRTKPGKLQLWNIVEYIIYASALRLSIDQLFGPIVLGKAARLPPVLIIFCFMAGGVLFGIVGVILAIPVALTIRIVLEIIYEEPAKTETA